MATVTAHRSAWGLDLGDESGWRQKAACTTLHADGNGWEDMARAAHQCIKHCAVLAQCLKDAEKHPPYAGIVQAAHHTTSRGLMLITPKSDGCLACGLPRPERKMLRLPPGDRRHGTTAGYRKCRCEACREAGRRDRASRRDAR